MVTVGEFQLPRWYVAVIGVIFLGYVGGWFYAIHLAHEQRMRGEAFVMPVGPHDSTSYANLSESLRHGYFAEPGEAYEYFHTPGYPVLVASIRALTGSYFAVTFLQILLVFCTAFMTYLLGRALVSEKVGYGASILFLLNPLVPYIALYILTDTLFTFLFTLGLVLLVVGAPRRLWASSVGAALCFACAVYVRPVGFIAFPIFIAPLFVLAAPFKTKLSVGIAMLALITVLLTPWMWRNKVHSGVFAFSSLVPLNMAYYEIPHYLAWHNHITIAEGIGQVEKESRVPQGLDASGYPANWYNLASAPALNHYIRETVQGSFFSYAVWHLYNSTGFFLNSILVSSVGSSINLKHLLAEGKFGAFLQAVTTPWWMFVGRVAVVVGLILMLYGCWRLRRNPRMWVFLLIICYFAALGGPSAAARLRLPVEPLLSIFIVVGMYALLERTAYPFLKRSTPSS